MPTPFENTPHAAGERRSEEWAARPAKPPRSVFGNYRPPDANAVPNPGENRSSSLAASLMQSDAGENTGSRRQTLQSAIDVAMARSFFYRFLAQAYEDPTPEGWARMTDPGCQALLESAVRTLAESAPALTGVAAAFRHQFAPVAFESFLAAYLAAFGHAARGRCPPNEIEYGDLKADPLFQPHRLADLAAFYRAFGLQVAADAGERHDHICLELEFICVLAAKEAYALEHQLDLEELALGRAAQKRFLREHLGRWTPAFARRLARMAAGTPLGALAELTGSFVEAECVRQGLPPGSEDLALRPVDAAADSMCSSCGVTQPAPAPAGS
jgi:DMSO reductase family type II enzyme chaperone